VDDGPFVFFDHKVLPTSPPAYRASRRPAHLNTGLSPITYLFEDKIMHRDSLGTVQPIHAL
jgi:redox-sensitive bicupin YhaK (pirin superfamily)